MEIFDFGMLKCLDKNFDEPLVCFAFNRSFVDTYFVIGFAHLCYTTYFWRSELQFLFISLP